MATPREAVLLVLLIINLNDYEKWNIYTVAHLSMLLLRQSVFFGIRR